MDGQPVESIAVAARPLYCRSVGWLLEQTKDCIVIVPHIGGERDGNAMQQENGDLAVPAQAIMKMTFLRKA